MPRILSNLSSLLLLALGALAAIESAAEPAQAACGTLSVGVQHGTMLDDGASAPRQFAAASSTADDTTAVESDDGLATTAPSMAATLDEQPLRPGALAIAAPGRVPFLVMQRVRLKI